MGYKFEIQYKPGRDNRAADALSRQELDLELQAVSLWQYDGVAELEGDISKDEDLRGIMQQLVQGKEAPKGYTMKKGVLYFEGRLVIPKHSPKKQELMKEFHDSPMGGHSGYLRTYKRLFAVVFWVGMKKDIQEYVAQGDICQRNKYEALSPAGLLQPLPIPQAIWEDIRMDFIGGLPRSHRFDTVMVVVDRLTKYAHFIPLSHPYDTKGVAEVFAREVIKLHGFPNTIVSDWDRVFTSQFWKELFNMAGNTLKYSSSYNPETDGQTEVVN